MALTFKPAAGSIVRYRVGDSGLFSNFLITGYNEPDHNDIAFLYDLDTGKDNMIIVEFFGYIGKREFNDNLTVIG